MRTNGEEPAAPCSRKSLEGVIVGYDGLTKREYLAGLALIGRLSNPGMYERHGGSKTDAASDAVDYADALLIALEEKDVPR